MDRLSYEQFTTYLRSALHYLYDPVHLRTNPLVVLLGLSDEFDCADALQKTLLTAIRALKPGEDEPAQSRNWRIYDTLHFQHVRQLPREVVTTQLGISERQLRREQRLALERLAQHLWSSIGSTVVPSDELATASSLQDSAHPEQALSEELTWLTKEVAEPLISLQDAIYTVHTLAQPLAQQWRAPLEIGIPTALADLQVPPLALRSILLTILSVAIPISGRAPVKIVAAQAEQNLELSISCPKPNSEPPSLTPKDDARLQTAQNLADFYGGRLTFSSEEPGFWARLVLPPPEQIPVLVIDDNADWIELQQRYAAGSRYQITGMRDPSNAHLVAQKLQPAVIFLDVMMHNVDGWQILSDLRHTPATTDIPVVVCSILPVEELALSLGANAFLQKPVTRHQFLKMLDFQLMRQS